MAIIHCRECGHKHSDRAEKCPKCGYRAFNPAKSIAVYLVLAWFLGVVGAHRFYAGKTGSAIAMLLMTTIGWILILPVIAAGIWALVDFIVGLCNISTPEKIFEKK